MKTPEDHVFDPYTEVVDPHGEQQVAVYVYEAPVRLWHWVNALCIVVLCITGYLIGQPPPSLSGDTSEQFLFGTIRFLHFAFGQVLVVSFIGRVYWAFAGNHHARQMFILPFWNRQWWEEILFELRWYFFLEPKPKKYIGHNPLAQFAMFTVFLLPMLVIMATGLALYSEGLGTGSWLYGVFGWVFLVAGDSFTVHTIHRLTMWVIILFAMVHIYAAIREDIMSRQSLVSTMISGWRMFRN